jgi:gamma-glutamylputrescine oxidase
MKQAYPFEEISNWVSEPVDIQPALTGDIRADVVIVGGGFTGLSTALSLRKRGVDVAILEQQFCGSGASGRNAGHLTPTIGKDIPSILRMFGREKAKLLIDFADAAIVYTVALIAELGIDCDYVPNGNIVSAVHAMQHNGLRKAADIAAELGAQVEWLDGDAMRQKEIPQAFTSGIWERHGGVLHPGKYVMGLRRAAINAGVRIHESTTVLGIEEGKRPVVRCSGGSVTAEVLVLATNAYTGGPGRLRRLVAPVRVTLFETEPLQDEQLRRLGWRGCEGIYTAHEMLESFRLTAHRTLIGGSKFVRSAWNLSLADGYHEPTFAGLNKVYMDRFPELSGTNIAKWWGGWIGMTTNFLPRIGPDPLQGNTLRGVGYNGHGIAQASLAGKILTDRITGQANPYSDLFAHPGLSWPPEPLTWIGSKALTGLLTVMDKRVDRRVHERRRSGYGTRI